MTTLYHFIASVDFGTTYSSVTIDQRPFADELKDVVDRHPKLFSIKNYPGASAKKAQEIYEVPTEILYNDGQTFYGYEAWKRWDNNMNGREILLQWFKLLLDDSEDEQQREEAQLALEQLDILHLTISEVIADYLAFLLGHTKSELQINNRYCDECTVQLVLPVPNIWSARASSIMAHSLEQRLRFLQPGNGRYPLDDLESRTCPRLAPSTDKNLMAVNGLCMHSKL